MYFNWYGHILLHSVFFNKTFPLEGWFNKEKDKACFFILKLLYGRKQPETCLNHEPSTCLR